MSTCTFPLTLMANCGSKIVHHLMCRLPASPYACDEAYATHESAMEAALWSSRPAIIKSFLRKPIPTDRVADLFEKASYRRCPEFVRKLLANGADPNATTEEGDAVLESFVGTLTWRHHPNDGEEDRRGLEALELVLAAGAKWNPPESRLRYFRRRFLDCRPETVSAAIGLFEKYNALSAEQLHELTRTPAIKSLLNGHDRATQNFLRNFTTQSHAGGVSESPTPARRYWKRHWSRR